MRFVCYQQQHDFKVRKFLIRRMKMDEDVLFWVIVIIYSAFTLSFSGARLLQGHLRFKTCSFGEKTLVGEVRKGDFTG